MSQHLSNVSVEPGNTLVVEVDITNTGNSTGDQDVVLLQDGGQVDVTQNVQIDSSNTQSLTLKWQTQESDGGEYTMEVSSDDNSQSFPVTVGDMSVSGVNPTYPYGSTSIESWQSPEPHPDVSNPVLTASDVTDVSANFVADPFIYVPDADDNFSDYHMFFEVQPGGDAMIGHATSPDGLDWTYNEIVRSPSHHCAFPQVFKWDGAYYLFGQGDDVNKLWKASASEFPTTWNVVANDLITERSYSTTDLALFRWDIDGDGTQEWVGLDNTGNTDLYVWFTDDLEANNWTAHSNNPVVTSNETGSRPAGRPIVRDDHVVMFYQDTVQEYGDKVRAYEIDTLTTSSFNQTELSTSPILEETGGGWNSDRMHHYDPWWTDSEDRWLAAVDGSSGGSSWSIGIYHVPTQ